jgi:hypothetical protein
VDRDYGAYLLQRPSALLALEKQLRGRPIADRVKLLRLQKTSTKWSALPHWRRYPEVSFFQLFFSCDEFARLTGVLIFDLRAVIVKHDMCA